MRNKFLLITSLFLLSGCASFLDGFAEKKIEKIEGERISVLKVGSEVSLDSSLINVPVNVPPAKINVKWYKSGGRDFNVPENVRAPKNIDKKDITRVGRAKSRNHHIGSTPVIADGRVYTVDSRGLVWASSVTSIREKVWAYQIDIKSNGGDFSSAGMLYHEGKLFVTTGYNRIVALDAESGQLIWRRTINSVARSAPAAIDNIVMVNTIDNKLYALNAADGAIEWTHAGVAEDISVFGAASPVAFGRMVFAPYSSGELYALRLDDGSEIWSDDLTLSNTNLSLSLTDIDASPIISGNKIYAVSNDGVLTAIDVYSGSRVWEKEISGNKTPWIAGNFLYILSDRNEVMCVNASTGGIKWIQQLPSYKKEESKTGSINWNGPVLAGGNLLVVGSNGRLLSIAPGSGEILQRYKVPKNIYLPPIVAHDRVYLLSDKAQLIALTGDLESSEVDDMEAFKSEKGEKKPSFFRRLFGL